MSSNTQPLSGNSIVPFQRVSLNSPSSGIILDSDITQSSLLVRTGNNSAFYIDKFANVGINTTSPGTQLEVASANGSCLRLRYGATSNFASIFMSSDGNLSLNPTGSEVNTNASLNISSHNGTTTGLRLGGSLVEATATQLNYIAVTPGAGTASKAIVLDSNKGISGITTLSSTSIAGTLTTAAQPNITSVGTLSALTVGNINITGNLTFSGGSSINTSLGYLEGVTPGTASASKALVLDSSSNITGIASIGTTSISIGGAVLGSAQAAYLTSITVGTAAGSKALVLDSNRDITNIRNLTASQLTGTIQTASQTNITAIGTLTNLTIGSATISGTEAAYITGLTIGTGSASKALILDTNRDITNIRNLTATGLFGIIQTSSQSNITSIGTLTSLDISGATTITSATDASSSTAGGALTVSGGLAVAKSAYIGTNLIVAGNLTVSGTTTTVNTTNMLVKDNTILLNSAPAGSFDSGLLIQRYQIANDSTLGDVIADTAKETTTVSSATSSTVILSTGNATNNYYIGWWIKVGTEARYISGYVGSTKTITLSSNFTSTPSNGAAVSLYNKSFSALTWNEANKQFATTYAAVDSSSTLTTLDYADLKVSRLFSTSAVNVSDATESSSTSTGSIITSGGVGIAKALRVGNGIFGTIQTAAQTNITSLGTLSSLTVTGSITTNGATFSSTEINYLLSITPGTATASKALIFDSNTSITGITSIGTTSLVLGGSTLGATQAGYLTSISAGTATASKALIVDSSTNISGIGTLSATSIAGTLTTASQTNITAIGTLTSLTIGSATLNGTNTAYLTSITAGIASASKALITDSSTNISGIATLSATSLAGTLTTASQPNITAIGTLTSLVIGSATLTGTQAAYLTGISAGTASSGKALVTDGSTNISGIGTLSATSLAGTLTTASQPNITAIGTLTSLTIGSATLNGTNTAYLTSITAGTAAASKALVTDASTNISGINSLSTTTLILNGTDVSSAITSSGYVTGITPGTATASKALVLDASSNISGVNSFGTTSLVLGSTTLGNTQAAYLTSITAGTAAASKALVVDSSVNITGINSLSTTTLIVNSVDVTASISASGYVTGVTPGTATASKALIIDASSNISGVNSFGTTSLVLGGTTLGATQAGYLTAITAGTAATSKALVTDSSTNISGIGTLSATSLAGTLTTASQTNITAIGTLTSLTIGSATLNGTNTAYLTSITAGTAAASKALITDASTNISGIGTLSATSIAGTLTTASQTNITAIGTLTSLTIGSATLNGTNTAYLTSITAGTAAASKALVTDSSINISGVGAISTTAAISTSITNATSTPSTYQSWTNTSGTITTNLLVSNVGSGIGSSTTHPFRLYTSNAARLWIAPTGEINIGASAQTTYLLQVPGTFNATTIYINGSIINSTAAEINYLAGLTTGTATASKALVIDSSKNIAGIGSIGLTGEDIMLDLYAATATKRSAITCRNDTRTVEFGLRGTTNAVNPNMFYIFNNAAYALLMDSNSNFGIGASPNSSYRLNTTTLNATSYFSSGTALDFAGLPYISSITPGTSTASKALVVDGSKNITGIGSIGATSLVLGATTITEAEIGVIDGVTAGTAAASKALVLNASSNITTGINSLTATNIVVGTSTLTSTNAGYLVGLTIGSASASKALVLDASSNISGIGTLSASSLTGTLTTAAQTAITSIGTLSSLTVSGNISGATLCLGTSTSPRTDTMITSYDTAQSATNTRFISWGRANTDRNAAELGFLYNGVSDATNAITIGFPTVGARMTILAGGNVGIGATSPGYKLEVNGTFNASSYFVSGVATDLTFLTGITAGTAAASKALILNASSNISGIGTLSATSLTGSLTTAAQTAITSVGTLTSLTIGGNTTINGTGSILSLTSSSSQITVNGNVDATNSTTGSVLLAGGIYVAKTILANANVTLQGTSSTLSLSGGSSIVTLANTTASTSGSTGALQCAGGAYFGNNCLFNTQISINGSVLNATNAGYLTSITPGTAAASKALVLDSNSKITGIVGLCLGTSTDTTRNLSILNSGQTAGTTFYTNTFGQANSTNNQGEIGFFYSGSGSTSNALRFGFHTNTNILQITADRTVTIPTLKLSDTAASTSDSTGAIQCAGGAYFGNNCLFNTQISINGSVLTATNAGYLTSITPGTAAASKALVLDSSLNIATINSLDTNMIHLGNANLSQASWTTNGIVLESKAITCTNTSTAASGTAASAVISSFGIATIAATNASVTTTNAATIYIAGAPTAGTNMTIGTSYALWINSGNTLTSGNITMNGTSANLLLSGASSTLTLSNTAASTSSITGALRCSGGAYFGSNCLFNAPITANSCLFNQTNVTIGGIAVTNSIFTTGSDRFYGWRQPNSETISILSYSAGGTYNDYITWAHNAGNPTCTMSASIIIPISSASTTSSTGAIQCAGGAYFGNNCLFNTQITIGASRTYNSSSLGANININDYTASNSYTASSGTDASHFKNVSIGTATLSTVSNTSVTTTNASSLYIQGTPVAGTNMTLTNRYSLFVNSGTSYFGGIAQINTGNAGLRITNSSNGVTDNTSILFTNNNRSFELGIRSAAANTAPANGFYIYDNANSAFRFVIDSSGNVGIGTNTPGSLLDVRGGIASTGFMTADRIRVAATNNASVFGKWDDADYWGIGENNTTNGVRIGICGSDGSWLGTYPTLVSGAYSNASDYRIKNTITPLSNVLNKIMELRPVSYYLNQDANKLNLNIGFIAHELQEQFPELVTGEKDGETHQSVNYAQLTSALVKGIQEQQININELEEKNKNLEDRLKRLEDMLLGQH